MGRKLTTESTERHIPQYSRLSVASVVKREFAQHEVPLLLIL